jgi:predicted alpha/beta superfamily hydrolase
MKYFFLFVFFYFSAITYAQDNNKINIGELITFKSNILGEEKQIQVNLPPGYGNVSTRYPVVIIAEGGAYFNYASELLNYLESSGSLPRMITVGIKNTQRKNFTPVGSTGNPDGADKLISFIDEELFPFLDSTYRTSSYRILFGNSISGLFTLYTMLVKPGLFNAYIAASPVVSYNNHYIVSVTDSLLKNKFESPAFLYYSVGNEAEHYSDLEEISGIIKAKNPSNLTWEYAKMYESGNSETAVLTLINGFSKLFKEWKLPDDFMYSGTAQFLTEHSNNLKLKYGSGITLQEEQITYMAYMLMYTGRSEEALNIFRYNTELFPASPAAYDNYGQGLLSAGLSGEAEKCFLQAVEAGSKINSPGLAEYKQHLDDVRNKLK